MEYPSFRANVELVYVEKTNEPSKANVRSSNVDIPVCAILMQSFLGHAIFVESIRDPGRSASERGVGIRVTLGCAYCVVRP